VTLCGPRVYTIVNTDPTQPGTVTLTQSGADGMTFTLESTANTDADTYTAQVEVHLQNYPDVKTQATATLTVTECVVTSITSTQASSY